MNDESFEKYIRNGVENTIQGICKGLWVAMGIARGRFTGWGSCGMDGHVV